ncbi:MAG TPA: FmdB family zinc ribbon protein [Acidimicrobiales bacterium]|nr:FmdB family zinc ribbon protein [Acidimicrobiales bacterium]
MPTYEYVCTSCGEHLEVVQSFRDDPLETCPICGEPLRKVFGSIGVVFKGSGFYKTDSRGGAKPAGGKEGEAKPAAAKDGEAKPAAEKAGTKETAKPSTSGSEGSSSGPSSPKTAPTSGSATAAAS